MSFCGKYRRRESFADIIGFNFLCACNAQVRPARGIDFITGIKPGQYYPFIRQTAEVSCDGVDFAADFGGTGFIARFCKEKLYGEVSISDPPSIRCRWGISGAGPVVTSVGVVPSQSSLILHTCHQVDPAIQTTRETIHKELLLLIYWE